MNYQVEMEKIINSLKTKPKMLLHVCCAPCSSYVLSVLIKYFDIDIIYYNPNITDEAEYYKRLDELKKFLKIDLYNGLINIVDCNYNNKEFFALVKG